MDMLAAGIPSVWAFFAVVMSFRNSGLQTETRDASA